MTNIRNSNKGLSLGDIVIVLLLLMGALWFIGSKPMGKGSTSGGAIFSPTCEGVIGKWIECKGKVISKQSYKNDYEVVIELYDKSEVRLLVDFHNQMLLELGQEAKFRVKVTNGSTYRNEDIKNIESLADVSRYCTGKRWSQNKTEQIAFGFIAVNIDVEAHPQLRETGVKLISVRNGSTGGTEVVDVQPFMGDECEEGVNLTTREN